MSKVFFILFSSLFLMTSISGQINAVASFNHLGFCNENELLEMSDVSSGAVDSREWQITGPTGFTTFTGVNSSESLLLPMYGLYNIELIVCDISSVCDTFVKEISVHQYPEAIISYTDTLVCFGVSVNFTGLSSVFYGTGQNYSWDLDYDTGIDTHDPSFAIFTDVDKTFMLIVEDDDGCSDTAFQKLYIIPKPEVDFDVSPICVDVSQDFDAKIVDDMGTEVDSFFWTIDNSVILSGQNITYAHSVGGSIPIVLSAISEDGCQISVLKTILVDELPIASILTKDTIICEGNSIDLEGTGNSNVLWLPDSLKTNTITVSPLETTNYTLSVSSSNNACPDAVENVLVEVIEEPDFNIDLSNDFPSMGTPVDISLTYEPVFSVNDSIQWLSYTLDGFLDYEYGSVNEFIAKEDVSLPIKLTYFKGDSRCVFEKSIDINVNDECSAENFLVPNVFSPNDNWSNETFIVKGFNIERIDEFIIFNRIGQEMYHVDNIEFNNGVANTGWNGRSKNEIKCNGGVYVYYFKTICINGLETISSGNITLVR